MGTDVDFAGISHYFGKPGSIGLKVLDEVSLRAGQGEVVTIIGPSGCGKSTLLNLAAGIHKPTLGTVRLDGREVIPGKSGGEVGYMFARDMLLPWRTALENVVLGLEFTSHRETAHERGRELRGREMMDRLGLAGFEDHHPSQLSHGMRQRVAIARTLITEPRLLLMDEPFGALDAQTKIIVESEFLQLWRDTGATVLFVTHDLTEAIVLADRVVVMSARPAQIIAEYEIGLDRPRDLIEMPLTDNFAKLRRKLWRDLQPELHKTT